MNQGVVKPHPSRFSGRHPPPSGGPLSAGCPPAATHPWPRVRDGSRSCARQTPARRSFQYVSQRGLHHAIPHRRYAQRSSLVVPGLGYPSPAHRLRTIRPVPQLRVQSGQFGRFLPRKMRHGLFLRPGPPALAPDLAKGAVQIGGRIGLVPQSEPDPVGRLTGGEPRQHEFGPDATFHPPPRVAGVSGLLRRCRHWRRLWFVILVHHPSTFLRPFAPRSLPASPLLRTF